MRQTANPNSTEAGKSNVLSLLQPAEVTRKMLRDKHNKKNPTQPNPVFPNWVYDRPALLGDFITSPSPPGDPAVAVGRQVLDSFQPPAVFNAQLS